MFVEKPITQFCAFLTFRNMTARKPLANGRILAIYTAAGALSNITWAYYRHPERLDDMVAAVAEVLANYDNMQNHVPAWYQNDFL